MQPLISIIIPAFNRSNFIGETLESVIAQTYQNWECIIVDDGSTDYSWELYEFYEKRDERLKFFSRDNDYKPGGNGARNLGVNKSLGNLVMFLDSDDLLIKTSLEERVDLLNNSIIANMYIFHTGLFDKSLGDCDRIWNVLNKGGFSNNNLILRFIDQDLPWHTTGVLWRKDFLIKIGCWNEDLLAWQDWEIHLRALMNKPSLSFSENSPDNFYRQNVENSIASQKDKFSYYKAVAQSIRHIEPLVLGLKHPEIERQFKYLIIRFFIIRPIQIRNLKLQVKILLHKFDFQILSGTPFLSFIFLENISRNQIVKRILKKIGFKNYYRNISLNSTHLAAKFNVDYNWQKPSNEKIR